MTVSAARDAKAMATPDRGSGWKRWRSVLSWLAVVVAIVIAAGWLFPFILVVLTSIQAVGLVSTDVTTWFSNVTLANYPTAWEEAGLGKYLLNSFVITVIKVPLGLVISSMCAFGLSRFRYRVRTPTMVVIIALAAVPIQIALISIFQIQLDAGLLNTYLGLILAYLAFGVPFQTMFLVAFFNQVPVEIEESARLDGIGPWRYLAQILMPLTMPLLAALFILDFVSTWNEFPIALTLLQKNELWTMPLGLLSFLGPYTNDYQMLSAAIVIAALPVLIVYLAMQRFFVSGLTAGAVKG